jgi:hypothetical protein
MRHRNIRAIGALLALFGMGSICAGGDRWVDDSAAPNGDGTSYTTPYDTLEEALNDDFDSGDTIYIAEGLYIPIQTGDPGDEYFVLPPTVTVHIRGGYPDGFTSGWDPAAHPTVLSADVNDDDAGDFGTNRSDNLDHILSGDGLGEVTISGVVFRGCETGGGPAFEATGDSKPSLIDCQFFSNDTSSPTADVAPGSRVERCVFAGNRASYGALELGGVDGIEIVECVFSDHGSGRPLQIYAESGDDTIVIVNCTVAGNVYGGINARSSTTSR